MQNIPNLLQVFAVRSSKAKYGQFKANAATCSVSARTLHGDHVNDMRTCGGGRGSVIVFIKWDGEVYGPPAQMQLTLGDETYDVDDFSLVSELVLDTDDGQADGPGVRVQFHTMAPEGGQLATEEERTIVLERDQFDNLQTAIVNDDRRAPLCTGVTKLKKQCRNRTWKQNASHEPRCHYHA